ncbi:hypothetical protein J5N97_008836 [Dioscorea zingiberensis]|uniref:C2 domain-containing protein n=1 Tax=Dioscorea zingiberensis TaxID=325984 RepID=A0A9D5HLE2_9LILI|nr:hypothetical protein J5N97_008836 [Dioscorea zingiberensis]
MASRTLEITLISAKDLRDVNLFSNMEVYAVVSIDGDSRTAQRTIADGNGLTNPSWNATVRFPVPADDPSLHVVHVILRTERALGDRDVGEVHIPLNEFFSGSGYANTPQFFSYQVREPSTWEPRGVLNLSFKISYAVTSPVTAYPAGPSGYPAPGAAAPYVNPQGYQPYAQPGYGNLPPGNVYGAPPQGYGYGAVPVPPQQPQMHNLFMRFGIAVAIDSVCSFLVDAFSDLVDFDI